MDGNDADIKKSSVTPQIEGFGTIVPGDAITVRSNTNGSLMRKAEGLRNGSFVSAGDLLFELDPFTFATAVTEAEIAPCGGSKHTAAAKHRCQKC